MKRADLYTKVSLSGVSGLTDIELIYGVIGNMKAAETIYHKAMDNIHEVGKMSLSDLMKIEGVGRVNAMALITALEIGRRRLRIERVQLFTIRTSSDAYNLFAPFLMDLDHEEMYVALLNRQNKVIEAVKISQGGVASTSADISIIFKAAVSSLASGIVICHNHPSGNLTPSIPDDNLTNKVSQAAKLLDINLLDHIIIGDNHFYSYADEGRL